MRLWKESGHKKDSRYDRAYLYDNSVENEAPKLLFRAVDGKLFRQYEEEIPRWAGAVMESL